MLNYPNTATMGVRGPLDGTGNPHPKGSYFGVNMLFDDDEIVKARLSRGALEDLRDQIIGILKANLK